MRKPVAIGVELASLPSVLFLDEPTAQMDTIEAWTVIHALKGLAAAGRSSCLVVCSMNEASSIVFSQITRLILLSPRPCVISRAGGGLGAFV